MDDNGGCGDSLGGLVIIGIICFVFPPAIFGFAMIWLGMVIFGAIFAALPDGRSDSDSE